MILEHTFVTTLEAKDALSQASKLLTENGFELEPESSFSMDGAWNRIKLRRGKKSPQKARHICELPQRIQMDYDRGRIVTALQIEAMPVGSFWHVSSEPNANSRKARPHIALMTRISQTLEALLVHRVDPREAAQQWKQLEAELIKEGMQKRRRRNSIATILLIVIALLLILSISFAVMNS